MSHPDVSDCSIIAAGKLDDSNQINIYGLAIPKSTSTAMANTRIQW